MWCERQNSIEKESHMLTIKKECEFRYNIRNNHKMLKLILLLKSINLEEFFMEFKPKKEYVSKFLSDEGQKFIIPEYQRPYRWGIDECETLWNDILEVFGNGEDISEYFLGSIVAYQNSDELEIIDGQQRITTLTLLFRAFYEHFQTEGENVKQDYIKGFGSCIWEYEIDVGLDFNQSHLISKVAIDSDQEALDFILKSKIDFANTNPNIQKSRYIANYSFFHKKISDFKQNRALQWESFCKMFLLKKIFVLLVVCDSQESAMTIFNTLNSRGLPLSSADVLKGYIYKQTTEKSGFAQMWKEIETKVDESENIKDLDFLFLQYMHIIRAESQDSDTTTQSVLNFFTKKDKKVYYGAIDGWLYKDETMPFLTLLTDFWIQPSNFLSEQSMKYMDILNLFQNDSWKSYVSCLLWKKCKQLEDTTEFHKTFDYHLLSLVKILTLAFINNNATLNSTKDIVFKMNVAIKQDTKYHVKQTMPSYETFCEITKGFDARKMKYLLFFYAHVYADFKYRINPKDLEVEHILPRHWQNANFNDWNRELHEEFFEQVGNKILLPKSSNLKCIENFFAKKQDFYRSDKHKNLIEVLELGNRKKNNWTKEDIIERNEKIYQRLSEFLKFSNEE